MRVLLFGIERSESTTILSSAGNQHDRAASNKGHVFLYHKVHGKRLECVLLYVLVVAAVADSSYKLSQQLLPLSCAAVAVIVCVVTLC
jgi:hypothetical protein